MTLESLSFELQMFNRASFLIDQSISEFGFVHISLRVFKQQNTRKTIENQQKLQSVPLALIKSK